jgi:hypothetical protein
MAMNNTCNAILVSLLLVSVVYSQTQEKWVFMLKSHNGDRFSVRRIQHVNGGMRRAWVKYEPAPNKAALEALGRRSLRGTDEEGIYHYTSDDSTLISTAVTYYLILYEFDHMQRRLRTLQTNIYFFDGNMDTDASDTNWTFTIPETPSDSLLNYVCSH